MKDILYSQHTLEILHTIEHCALRVYGTLRTDNTNYLATTNVSGDSQLAVDVLADKLIEGELLRLDCINGICSEEKKEAIYKKSAKTNDKGFLVAYDPLDGSSLFDANLSVGSIFGIYEGEFGAKNIVGAAYVLYGPRLEIVFASNENNEVIHLFFNDEEWIKKPNLTLKSKGKLNAPGGTQQYWSIEHKGLIEWFFAQGYRLRYSGGMVPDLHHILLKGGGIFSYPATNDAPRGKLRKLFEVFPFAFIYEKAGGEAINGTQRLLEIKCDSLHDTTPCFFGSKEEIERVKAVYKNL